MPGAPDNALSLQHLRPSGISIAPSLTSTTAARKLVFEESPCKLRCAQEALVFSFSDARTVNGPGIRYIENRAVIAVQK
jgi:hypothetical protein